MYYFSVKLYIWLLLGKMIAETKTRLLQLGTDTNFVIQVLAGQITPQPRQGHWTLISIETRTQYKIPTQDIINGKQLKLTMPYSQ